MATRTSEYPIGKLILRCIEESGLSVGKFVLAIGYGNPDKGVRALDSLLHYGSTNPVFFERLTSSQYAPNPEELGKVQQETEEILKEERRLEAIRQEAEDRAAFRPYVQGVPELQRPTSITCYAFTGGASRFTIELPPAWSSWSPAARQTCVKGAILAHYASCKGRTLFRGDILAYRLYHTYGEPSVLYSIRGEPLGLDKNPPEPNTFVRIGKKTLTGEEVTRIFGFASRE